LNATILFIGRTLITDREHNFYKRTIFEMIYIKEQNIGLNSNTKLLNDSYFDILNELAEY